MKLVRVGLALLGAMIIACGVRAATIELRDQRGLTVRLAAPARRIVSAAPALTEIAFAAGAADSLVGAGAWSDYPDAARALPQVGDAFALDLERILALRPDLVLTWKSGTHPSDIARIEAMGIPVLVVEAHRISDIPRVMRLVGAAAGRPEAEAAANAFEQQLAAFRARFADAAPVSVFIEVWHAPPMTVNGSHFASAALEVCGGRNIFADANTLTPIVGMEDIVFANPAAIVGGGSNVNQAQLRASWDRYRQIRAVRNGHVFHIDPDLIQRPGPRIIDGIARLCSALDQVRRAQAGARK